MNLQSGFTAGRSFGADHVFRYQAKVRPMSVAYISGYVVYALWRADVRP